MSRRVGFASLFALVGAVIGFATARILTRPSTAADGVAESELPSISHDPKPIVENSYLAKRLRLETEFKSATTAEARTRILTRMRDAGMESRYLLAMWAEKDPEAFIAYASDRKAAGLWVSNAMATAFKGLWISDSSRAEELAAAFPTRAGRSKAFGSIAREAIVTGHPEALRIIAEYSSHLSEDFHATYPQPPLELFAPALAKLPDTSHSVDIARKFAERWYADDPKAAMAWVKSLPHEMLRSRTHQYLLGHVANQSPEKAMDLHRQLRAEFPDLQPFDSTLVTMARHVHADDPVKGAQWVNENLPLRARDEYFANLASSIGERKGAEAAIDLLREVPPGQRGTMVREIALNLARKNPVEALDWLGEVAKPLRSQALSSVASQWAANDLAAARSHVESGEVPYPRLAAKVAERCAESDPQAAVQWTRDLPPERAGDAHKAAVVRWSRHHPASALQYAQSLPEGEERSNLVYIGGANLFRTDPAAGEAWLRSLTNRIDRQAARSSIGVTSTDESERQRLIKILEE